jgi:aminoglycoside phosphotransferase (APT) family kinase protein
MKTQQSHTLKKIAQGREAEMFAWDEGRVLRLYFAGFPRPVIDAQIAALRAVRDAGVRVPEVFETVEREGRAGIIMERIDGIDLLTLIGRRPWKVWWVARVCGEALARINMTPAPGSLPALHERYRHIIGSSPHIPPEFAAPALAALDALPEGDRLLHGDFHPGNVMMQDGEPVILDWSNATRGCPEADLARTSLMMQLGDPPPGTAVIIRVFARFARFILLGSEMSAYRRTRPPDEELLRRWELPVAVARLDEPIPAERARLLRFIERRLPAA